MSVIDFQWTKTIIVWFCMTGHTYSASIKKEITCYVCTPPEISDSTLEHEFYSIFTIDEVDRIPTCGTTAATNFTLKCPKNYHGCVAKHYGKEILKSCNTFSITDCKFANGVNYCYCADNLCNSDAKVLNSISTITDDEDLDQSIEEGSGSLNWKQFDKKYPPRNVLNTTTVIQNNTSKEKENDSITKASAVKLFLSRSVNVISLIFIIFKFV